jgi:hypothetical protein
MMWTAAQRRTVSPSSAPSVPRLRLEPTPSRPTLLDGGWWPRSADPVAELPGLILAVGERHGRPVSRLMLGPAGWDSQPRRLDVAGHVVKVGWFAGQPDGLLTAICEDGERVDLVVVPPDTEAVAAQEAMTLATQDANTVHAPDILAAVIGHRRLMTEAEPETVWESEGGRL